MFNKILLAVDTSQHSAKAVATASELARMADADVLVFHVRALLSVRGGQLDVDMREEEANIAEDVAERLQHEGVKATGVRIAAYHGDTGKEIVEAAVENHTDVIVMGSRGHSEIPSLLLGSVTHKVLHLASVPVLVVR
jgi:nucleotide-binding universal stress UspA family protein